MSHTAASPDTLIVYFGNDWFAENRTSSHHIARLLGEKHPLIYIETPGLRNPTASSRDLKKLFRKLAMALQPPRLLRNGMWHVTVPQIPFRKIPFAASLNRWIARHLVRRAIRAVAHSEIISWFVVPHPHEMAGTLGESLVVYYCVDDYASFPGMDSNAISAMDYDLTVKADIVFAVSKPLVDSKRLLNANTFYSPHGVDYALFAKAADPGTAIPLRAQGLQRPVIGFFGVIGAWIDLPLLRGLAESRPDWTFLMVGLVSTDISDFLSLPNVQFVGPQPYGSLPGWAAAFDVAIIPTLPTRQRIYANPLKLREYLATGRPVVATPTSATESFADVVQLAATPSEFLAEIERLLTNDSHEDRRKRQASVSGLTWEARFQEIYDVVARDLTCRRKPLLANP